MNHYYFSILYNAEFQGALLIDYDGDFSEEIAHSFLTPFGIPFDDILVHEFPLTAFSELEMSVINPYKNRILSHQDLNNLERELETIK